jgi:RimJ/RimL family protein N-acetyltransferase/GNAT superfamily N-acetyltransferase
MRIERDGLTRPAVHALLQEHLEDMRSLSPPEQVFALDLDKLRHPDISFWTAWEGDALLGCGALKALSPTHGELKSMRTPSAARRKGAGRALLLHIIAEAKRRGYDRLSLESGSHPAFGPAHGLYAGHGFRLAGPFGAYRASPHSVFMTLQLQQHSPVDDARPIEPAAFPSPPAVPGAIEFDTERLKLRIWQDQHRADFAAMNADPAVMRYFPALLTAEQSNAGIDIWIQQFAQSGWSNWAVERQDSGEFIGFIGLSVPRRLLPFSPCVEIGWRLKQSAWGRGYATEGAMACLRVGFEQIGLDEIVSFTTLSNHRSIAVMERIGMRDTRANFEHPAVPEQSALRAHCLYKISRASWRLGRAQPSFTPGVE